MSKLLKQLEKLIALAVAPMSGPDEEARSAAMLACKIIRDNRLRVWSPKGLADPPGTGLPSDPAVTILEALARAAEENPVRLAMKRRAEERAVAEQVRRTKAPTIVG